MKTVKEALEMIMRNQHQPALNYCISYADYALLLVESGHNVVNPNFHTYTDIYGVTQWISDQLKSQLLYVLNNMTAWRKNKKSTVTSIQIARCREILRRASK